MIGSCAALQSLTLCGTEQLSGKDRLLCCNAVSDAARPYIQWNFALVCGGTLLRTDLHSFIGHAVGYTYFKKIEMVRISLSHVLTKHQEILINGLIPGHVGLIEVKPHHMLQTLLL